MARKKKTDKKTSKKEEKPDKEIEVIKKIADRIIKVYESKNRVEDAERMRKIVDYLSKNPEKGKETINKVIDKMMTDIESMIRDKDYASALAYLTQCLDYPDTIVAYTYMWRPEFTELILSITAKAISLIVKMSKR